MEGNVSSGRPPVAPRSAKEEYAAALRAQMAEKEAREPRGRSRVRTPESAGGYGAPASVAPASRDPSQDRRTAQLECAAFRVSRARPFSPNGAILKGPFSNEKTPV